MGKEVDVPDWLPPDWRMEIRTRKGGYRKGQQDKYFIEPSSKHLFRSKTEVLEYLKEGKFRSRPRKKEKESSAQTPCGEATGIKKRRKDFTIRKQDKGGRYKAVRKLFESPCSRSKRHSTHLQVSDSSEGHITETKSSNPRHNDSKSRDLVHVEASQCEEKKGVEPKSMSLVNVMQINAIDKIEEQKCKTENCRSSSTQMSCVHETETVKLDQSVSTEKQVASVAIDGVGLEKNEQMDKGYEQQPGQQIHRTRHKIENSAGWGRCEGDSKSKRLMRVNSDCLLSNRSDVLQSEQANFVEKIQEEPFFCKKETGTEKSPLELPLGGAWSDRCLQFAFKTLSSGNESKFLGFDQADVSQVAKNKSMDPQPARHINGEKQSRYRDDCMNLKLEMNPAELVESKSTGNGDTLMAVNAADMRKETRDKGSAQKPVNQKRSHGHSRQSTQQPLDQKRPRGRPRLNKPLNDHPCEDDSDRRLLDRNDRNDSTQKPPNQKRPRGRPRLNKPLNDHPCEDDSDTRLLDRNDRNDSPKLMQSKQAKLVDETPLCTKTNKTQSSQSVFPFYDAWADPCLEFAFKTLTGDSGPDFLGFVNPESVQAEKKEMDHPSIGGLSNLQVPQTDSTKEENNGIEHNEFLRIHGNLTPKSDQFSGLGKSVSSEITGGSAPVSAGVRIEGKNGTNAWESVVQKNCDSQHINKPAGWGRGEGDSNPRRLGRQNLAVKPCKSPDALQTNQAKLVAKPLDEPAVYEKESEAHNSPVTIPFADAWSDPCLEFAFKTLTGVIPLPDLHLGVQNLLPGQPNTSHSRSLGSPVPCNSIQTQISFMSQIPSSSVCTNPTVVRSSGLSMQNHSSSTLAGDISNCIRARHTKPQGHDQAQQVHFPHHACLHPQG